MVFEQSSTQAISAQMGSLDIGKAELSNRLKWGGGGKILIRLHSCLSGETGWSTAEINKVTNVLELSDAWAHIELAKSEQILSNSRLAE